MRYVVYEDDVSDRVRVEGQAATAICLRKNADFVLLVGNTIDRTVSTGVSLHDDMTGSYRLRRFDSLIGNWSAGDVVEVEQFRAGLPLEIERNGFCLRELGAGDGVRGRS